MIHPEALLPVIIMAIAGILAVSISIMTLKWRNDPGGIYFILMMAAVAIFAFADSFEAAALTIPAKIMWAKISYVGVVSIPPLWFLFAVNYSQHKNWLTPIREAALWVLPLIILCLAATNEWHYFIWTSFIPISPLPGARLVYGHGLGVWINAAYAYTLMLGGSYLLIQTARQSSRLHRWQIGSVVIAGSIPWLGNLLYILNLNPWPGLDITPIAFVLTGLLLAGSLYKFQLFDLRPVAFEVVFDSIGDGVLVLDNGNRLVSINATGLRWLCLDDKAIGRNIFDILPINEVLQRFENTTQLNTRLETGEGEERRVYDLTITPLNDMHGRLQGRVALLHDVSHKQALLDQEHLYGRQVELLNQITHAAIGTKDLESMLQTLADHLGELFNADGAFLTLWDEGLQRVIPKAAYGVLKDIYPSYHPESGEKTITESALNIGHVIVIEDAFNSPHLSSRIASLFPTRSLLALPLIADGRKQGAAIIGFNQSHVFSPREISLGEQVGGQIALAIAKAQLLDAETRRVDQLTALQSMSQMVVSSLELNQVFETVINILHNTFGYHYVSIYRLFEDNLHLNAQVGYPEESILWEIPVNTGVMGRAVRSRQPQFIRNAMADPDFLRASQDVTSEICVPLLKGQVVLGTLNIESTLQRSLDESDLQLLITFANQVVVAIENASLFEAEREQRKLAEALREVGLALSENLDFEVLLDRMLVEIGRVIPYSSASVILMDKEREFAHISRLSGYEQYAKEVVERVSALKIEVAKTPTLKTMLETCQPMIIADTLNDPNWQKLTEYPRTRSWAGAPIILRNQVIGFLSLDKVEPGFYRLEHTEKLAAFTSQAAVAMENARLYAEVQHLAILDELTGLYNRRGLFDLGMRELDRSNRFGYSSVALFIDIDHFKLFNDTYSYAVGDQVLRQLAYCLRANLREFDVIGRYGGEEFIAILPEVDLQTAYGIAERVRAAAEALRVNTEYGETNFTISIGVCQHKIGTLDVGKLIDSAGLALHEAKEKGRNRVEMLGEE